VRAARACDAWLSGAGPAIEKPRHLAGLSLRGISRILSGARRPEPPALSNNPSARPTRTLAVTYKRSAWAYIGGVCLPPASPRRRCALTAKNISPLRPEALQRARLRRCNFCGTFPRVPRVGVTDHLALRCPGFSSKANHSRLHSLQRPSIATSATIRCVGEGRAAAAQRPPDGREWRRTRSIRRPQAGHSTAAWAGDAPQHTDDSSRASAHRQAVERDGARPSARWPSGSASAVT